MRALAAIACLAGCFGEGPTPSAPSEATILFALELQPLHQDNCRSASYIGNVAVGSDAAYAITHTFLPACSGGNGNPEEQLPSSVFAFGKRGGPRMKIGDAGMSQEGGGSKPRVAAFGTEAVWMYTEPAASAIQVRSKSGSIGGSFQPSPGFSVPTTILVDANATYVAGAPPPAGPWNPNAPRYPCCGTSNTNGAYGFFQLTNASSTSATAMPGTPPRFFGEQMREAMVANSTTLFYVQHAMPGATIHSQPKNGSAGEQLGMIAGQPAGLAADDVHVVWSTTLDFTTSSPGRDFCSITSTTTAAPRTETLLLSTSKFSCLDLALDGSFVYFTIVEMIAGEGDDLVRNVGIGRVSIDTRELETIALGISSPQAGPRQLFVDDDGLIVVAPFVVARIAKTALDGHQDIAK